MEGGTMKQSTWSKIAGWAQFGIMGLAQVAQSMSSGGSPHGWSQWLGFGASLATAVAIHGASSTDGAK